MKIVDISHDIPPFDIVHASFVLKNTFKEFSSNQINTLQRYDGMTIEGTVNKTAISLCLLLFSGYFSYTQPSTTFIWIGLGLSLIHI